MTLCPVRAKLSIGNLLRNSEGERTRSAMTTVTLGFAEIFQHNRVEFERDDVTCY